jgi:hypothetical protein
MLVLRGGGGGHRGGEVLPIDCQALPLVLHAELLGAMLLGRLLGRGGARGGGVLSTWVSATYRSCEKTHRKGCPGRNRKSSSPLMQIWEYMQTSRWKISGRE